MDTAHHHEVQRLFETALNRPEAEREAFVRTAALSENVAEEVLRLLAAVADEIERQRPMDGRRVGPYRIERAVGRGGMGAVYLAHRADGQFEQTVALKLIKRGMDSDAVLRRFHQERQILARLQHPAIARLLGGGMTDDGRPYFALEYVEGATIREHCDRNRLGVDARLALFEQVCDAVAYAHRNLVVHRDLKPSNILVTPEGADGGPSVKLLDFGIARLLDADDEITVADARPMTLTYAAPEQVRGGAVTTATDVYALGVLLYELLAGRRPHDAAGTDGFDVQRAIIEDDPQRPSTAVGRTAPTGGTPSTVTQSTAETHGLEPPRLRRRLAGDLDQIVLKALRKEPDERYRSAEALRDDVARHRAGLPVLARPATLGYRLRAFTRRHRAGVVTGALAAALLVGTVAFYTVRLAAERDRAQREAARAQQTATFLRSLFDGANPRVARGETLTARDLLDQGRARIAEELADQPLLQAEMLGLIGQVYDDLSLYPAADSALTRSLALYRSAGADVWDVARAEAALGDVRLTQGRYAEADLLLTGALGAQRAARPGPQQETAETLKLLGVLRQETSDYAASEPPLREALAMRRALHDGDQPETAEVLFATAQSLFDLGRYEAADSAYAETFAMQRRLFGERHPAIPATLRNHSALLRRLNRHADAEPLARRAVWLDSVLVGTEHQDYGQSLYEYASLLKDTGRLDEAVPVFDQALDVDLATLGPDHPYTALTIAEIGQVQHRLGRPGVALGHYRRALSVQRAANGDVHHEVATMLVKIGDVHLSQGDYAAADDALREAIEIRHATLGPHHPITIKEEARRAMARVRAGALAEGLALFGDAQAQFREHFPADFALAADTRLGMADALIRLGTAPSLEAALALAAQEVEANRTLFPAPSRELGIALLVLGDALLKTGDADAAHAAYDESLTILSDVLGPGHPTTERTARSLDQAARA